jgi:hypothetical protein
MTRTDTIDSMRNTLYDLKKQLIDENPVSKKHVLILHNRSHSSLHFVIDPIMLQFKYDRIRIIGE